MAARDVAIRGNSIKPGHFCKFQWVRQDPLAPLPYTPKRIKEEYDLPPDHNTAKDWTFKMEDSKYRLGLIKMMEWRSPLAEQGLVRFCPTIINSGPQ